MGPDFFFTTSYWKGVVWKDCTAARETAGVGNLIFDGARIRSRQVAQMEEDIVIIRQGNVIVACVDRSAPQVEYRRPMPLDQ